MTRPPSQPEPPTRRPSRTEQISGATALLVAAIVLRAPVLGADTLWFDDAWVAYAHRARWSDITEIALSAPGFSALLKVWFGIVGFGSTRAQLIPFAAAVAAPPLAYLLLRRRVGPVPALAGAAWILFSPVHLVYSGRVKQYSLELVLALLVVHTSWRVLENPDDRRAWRDLAIVTTIAVGVSFPMALVAAPACAVPLLVRWWERRRIEPSQLWLLVPLLTTVAWYVIAIRHRQYPNLIAYWQDEYVQTDAGLRIAAESFLGRIADVAGFLAPGPYGLTVIVVGALIAVAARSRPLHTAVVALTLAAAAGLAFVHRAPLGGGRTDIYLLGGLVMITAVGFDTVLGRGRGARTAAASLLAIVVVVAAVTVERPTYPDQRATHLIAEIEQRRQPGDAVLVYHNAKYAWMAYTDVEITVIPRWAPYGIRFEEPDIIQQSFPPNAAAIPGVLDRLAGVDERLWLIGTDLRWSWQATLDMLTENGWTIVEHPEAGPGRMVLFERSDP
jgi:hypothetical protein